MSWEFWNEVNWTPLAGEAVLGPWIQRSAAVIRNLDPYDHLLTTSGSRITDAEVWKDLDYTQDHYYDMPDLQRLFNNEVAGLRWLRNTGLQMTDALPKLKSMLVQHALG